MQQLQLFFLIAIMKWQLQLSFNNCNYEKIIAIAIS